MARNTNFKTRLAAFYTHVVYYTTLLRIGLVGYSESVRTNKNI